MAAKTTAERAVLVLDSNADHLTWTSNIVRGVAPSATSATWIADAQSLGDYELIIANYDTLHGRDRRWLFDIVDRQPPTGPRLLLVSSSARDRAALYEELQAHSLTNVLVLDGDASENDLLVTTRKLLQQDIFGLDKYFGDSVQTTSATAHGSAEISRVVDIATDFANELGVHPRLIENVATVVDELVTNALYNAPVDAAGMPRFAHLPRTTPVALDSAEEVAVTLCSDGQTLGLSVADSFGALTKAQSVEYLTKCMRGHDEAPRRDKGGAGLGLYMAFDALNHLVLNICSGRKTEVIGLLDIRGSYRNFISRGKSFNIFLCARDGQ